MIPFATLKAAPYNLEWATYVYAKVKAVTLVGSSSYSDVGTGAEIIFEPDAPQSFMNNVGVSNKDQIGVTWYEGSVPGGRPVEDYRLWYADGLAADYEVLADGLTATSFTLSTTMGNWYKFKVQARNSVGYGEFSPEL